MSAEDVKTTKLWILGVTCIALFGMVSWTANRLVSTVDDTQAKVTQMNETLIGFMASQTQKNEYTKDEIEKIKAEIDRVKARLEEYRIIGKAINESTTRGGKSQLDVILDKNKPSR